jgi:hypothetical protein
VLANVDRVISNPRADPSAPSKPKRFVTAPSGDLRPQARARQRAELPLDLHAGPRLADREDP